MKRKPAAPKFTTPPGVARYCYLNEADEYKGVRTYKTELILSQEDASKITESEAFKAAVVTANQLADEAAAKSGAKGKKAKQPDYTTPFYEIVDKETKEDTGDLAFKFKAAESWEDKETGETRYNFIPFFDAKGAELGPVTRDKKTGRILDDERPRVYSGSRIRVSYSLVPYHNAAANNFGVSLRMRAIKVLELNQGGASAASYGFGDDEEGYASPTTSAPPPASEDAYGSSGSDEADF